jgi:calcium-dependent protein kinase
MKSPSKKDNNIYMHRHMNSNILEFNDDIKNEMEQNPQFYQRKKRKSTTLRENSNILKQLFQAEMSIPINQEILVQEQKGNPNDKYLRGKKLGKGTFGIVYEAKNLIFNSKVAMKVIPKNARMNNELIKNEIDILKKLMHPNIVRIYEFYELKNSFYLINEFCPCGELFNYINKTILNEEQLAVIFYQVFSGLKYLHENNILHRDLKPENLLISKIEKDLKDNKEYFWIQIIDFGTAKIFENDKDENSIVGTPYYIAPEVLNKHYNEKCDTWSIGVILYMFLVGRAPFDGGNRNEIINSIKTKDYDENNPKLLEQSPEVRDLIKHLLQKDTNLRFSAKEALNHVWFKKFNGRKLFANFNKKDIEPYIDNLLNYTFNSKIQQLVIAFLVHNLPSTSSCYTILKFYRYCNESGDCKLTKDELIKGIAQYRDLENLEEKINNLFILLDGNNNGYIEYEEFLRACIDKNEILNDEYLRYAFKFLDKEKNGCLNVDQISSAFLVGENENKLFQIAIDKALNDVDGNGDGKIIFEEFKQLMLNL